MKVEIYLVDGGRLTIQHMDPADAMAMREELVDPDVPDFMQVLMDGDTVLFNRRNVTRIEFITS